MQKIECNTDFSCIKSSMLLWKSPLPLHVKHQISTSDKLNNKEQPRKDQISNIVIFVNVVAGILNHTTQHVPARSLETWMKTH